MSRQWNGKAVVDYLADRLGDTRESFRSKIISWLNIIQDDLVSDFGLPYFEFELKKLLPTQTSLIDLSPQIPEAPTTELASGGSLVDTTEYIIYITFVIYQNSGNKYIESEPSVASTARVATGSTLSIDLTNIDTYDGDTSTAPTTIYRRIYVSKKSSTDDAHGEPFFSTEIQDNTTTTATISAEPTSTITPPSDSEVDQLSDDDMYFASGVTRLTQEDRDILRRRSNLNETTSSPRQFDYIGTDSIYLAPKISSSATTAQRTLNYFVLRRPHEIFYEVDRPIDLPITSRKALYEGVIWLSYSFRDRDGVESKEINYNEYKDDFQEKMRRQKGEPSHVRDVMGDTHGYEV